MSAKTCITILGLGRTARAAAAYLMEKGCCVTMWGRDPKVVEELSNYGISITGACAGHYTPVVLGDIAKAVSGAEWIFVLTLASGHASIARQLRGLLECGQKIVIFNGNWGAYEFYQELGEDVNAPGADGHAQAPQFVPAENVVSTSLNSSNPVMHTPITLFNITRMENGEDYSFYADGATRLTLGAVESIDVERCAVAKAMGVTPVRCVEIINSFWPDKYSTLYDAVKNNTAYLSGKGPKTVKHRYLEEDLPFGMVPVSLLGKLYGVPTPNIDAMLACYHWLMGVDYRSQAPKFTLDVLNKLIQV